jgi:hypothetical protein
MSHDRSRPREFCIEHPDRPVTFWHHPVPKSRGGTYKIPLCDECHGKAHHDDDYFMSLGVLRQEGIARARAQAIAAGKPWRKPGRKPVVIPPDKVTQVKGLTNVQAAKVLGCSTSTIERARVRAGLPPRKTGRPPTGHRPITTRRDRWVAAKKAGQGDLF